VSGACLLLLVALVAGCTPQIGNKCTISTDCSQLGDRLCDTTQPGGYCTIFNCEPDQCPNAICVAFDPTLDPACGLNGAGSSPRFERSFCLGACNTTSDCRDQYQCVDLSDRNEQMVRRARVVDLGAADGGLGFKVCMAASCGDGLQDGLETDVDCGGPVCPACPNQKACISGSDCMSGICSAGTCVGPNCDGKCGGTDCALCTQGQTCSTGSDCTSGYCIMQAMTSGGRCDFGDCRNGKKDPMSKETDVDCGGGAGPGIGCPSCATGKGCNVGTDCVSGVCNQEGVCAAPAICFLPDAGPDYDAATLDAN
jgi:hypothetical protein